MDFQPPWPPHPIMEHHFYAYEHGFPGPSSNYDPMFYQDPNICHNQLVPHRMELYRPMPARLNCKQAKRSVQDNMSKDMKNSVLEGFSKPVESHKAARIMHKMGWQGGAIGKNGSGLREPLTPNIMLSSGAGLGHKPEGTQHIREKTQKQPLKPKNFQKQPIKARILQKQPTKAPIPQKQVTKVQISQKQVTNAQIPQKQLTKVQISQKQVTKAQIPQKQVTKVQISQKQVTKAQIPQKEPHKAQIFTIIRVFQSNPDQSPILTKKQKKKEKELAKRLKQNNANTIIKDPKYSWVSNREQKEKNSLPADENLTPANDSTKPKMCPIRFKLLSDLLAFVKDNKRVEMRFDTTLTDAMRKLIRNIVENVKSEDINFNQCSLMHPALESVFNALRECNKYVLQSTIQGEGTLRHVCVFKEAPSHIYLITRDDLEEEHGRQKHPFKKQRHQRKTDFISREQDQNKVKDLLKKYLKEFFAGVDYTEMRFLGDFDDVEQTVVDDFVYMLSIALCGIVAEDNWLLPTALENKYTVQLEKNSGEIIVKCK